MYRLLRLWYSQHNLYLARTGVLNLPFNLFPPQSDSMLESEVCTAVPQPSLIFPKDIVGAELIAALLPYVRTS